MQKLNVYPKGFIILVVTPSTAHSEIHNPSQGLNIMKSMSHIFSPEVTLSNQFFLSGLMKSLLFPLEKQDFAIFNLKARGKNRARAIRKTLFWTVQIQIELK